MHDPASIRFEERNVWLQNRNSKANQKHQNIHICKQVWCDDRNSKQHCTNQVQLIHLILVIDHLYHPFQWSSLYKIQWSNDPAFIRFEGKTCGSNHILCGLKIKNIKSIKSIKIYIFLNRCVCGGVMIKTTNLFVNMCVWCYERNHIALYKPDFVWNAYLNVIKRNRKSKTLKASKYTFL